MITHNDLDGAGCAVLAKRFLNINRIVYCSYESIDGIARSLNKNETTIITDIAPSIEVCRYLDGFDDIVLIDHHKTKKWLNKYKWSIFDETKCGTSLFLEWLSRNNDIDDSVSNFCKSVNAWDMWLLGSEYRNRGENLNDLLRFVGMEKFVNSFSSDINADKTIYKTFMKVLDDKKELFIKETIDKQLKHFKIHKDGLGNKYVTVTTNEYISEIGNAALELNNEIDYVAIISWNRCSLRSKNVDVSEIAKRLRGGGHYSASGFMYGSKLKTESLIHRLLGNIGGRK